MDCTDVLSVPLRTSETHENTSTKKPLSADDDSWREQAPKGRNVHTSCCAQA